MSDDGWGNGVVCLKLILPELPFSQLTGNCCADINIDTDGWDSGIFAYTKRSVHD